MTVSGVRSSRRMLGAKAIPPSSSTVPPSSPKVTEVCSALLARWGSLAPMAWPAMTLVPTEIPENRPMMQVISVELAPTAAAAVLSIKLPTYRKSTVL